MPLPALAIAGIGAAAGGILSGLLHKPKKNYTVQDLVSMGYKPYDKTKELSDWSNKILGMINERRANATQKAESIGISSPTGIYRSEADLVDALAKGRGQIDEKAQEEQNTMSKMLFNLNYVEDQKNTLGQDILGGIFSGASIGSSIANLAERIKPEGEKTTEPTETKVEPTKIKTIEKLPDAVEEKVTITPFPKTAETVDENKDFWDSFGVDKSMLNSDEGVKTDADGTSYNHNSTNSKGDNNIFAKYFGKFYDNQQPSNSLNGLVAILNPELREYQKLFNT